MNLTLPFQLKVAGSDEFRGFHAVSTSFRFRGFLSLTDDILTIEWGGVAQVQDVGALSVRDDRLPLPDERIVVPAALLYRAALAGGWWRPRLTLQARDLATLAVVPSEDPGTVHFWYARRDRSAARDLVAAVNDAIAAGRVAELGPGSRAVIHQSSSTPPDGREAP